MLAEVLAYLHETEDALWREVKAAGDDLHRAAPDGGWSPAQNVRHLIVTEQWMYPLWTLVSKLGRWPSALRAMDRMNSALWRAMGMTTVEMPRERPKAGQATGGKFVAPVFLRPRGDTISLDELWAQRKRTRDRSLRAIEKIPEADLARLEWSHPLLGRYTLLEFVRFLGIHEERHTAQIRRARA